MVATSAQHASKRRDIQRPSEYGVGRTASSAHHRTKMHNTILRQRRQGPSSASGRSQCAEWRAALRAVRQSRLFQSRPLSVAPFFSRAFFESRRMSAAPFVAVASGRGLAARGHGYERVRHGGPTTAIGTLLSPVAPIPSCPTPLFPQQTAAPLLFKIPERCPCPAVRAVKAVPENRLAGWVSDADGTSKFANQQECVATGADRAGAVGRKGRDRARGRKLVPTGRSEAQTGPAVATAHVVYPAATFEKAGAFGTTCGKSAHATAPVPP